MPRKRRRTADVTVDENNRPTKIRRVKETEVNDASLEAEGIHSSHQHSPIAEFSTRESPDNAVLSVSTWTSGHDAVPTFQMYAELKRSKKPKKWRRLPSLKMVQLLTSQWLIPSMVEVNLENLHSTIKTWFKRQKLFVKRQIQEIEIQQYSPWVKQGKGKASKRNLVAIQFQCLRCQWYCGSFDVAIRHMLSDSCEAADDYCQSLDFSDHFKLLPTTPLAAWILDDQQLDAFTTTADHLDAENRAYECIQCRFAAQDDGDTRAYRMYMTWREFINHKCEWKQDFPFYHNPTAYQSVGYSPLFGSSIWPIYQQKIWSCGICNEFVDVLGSRQEVEEHLKAEHGVVSPQVPGDIFYAADF